MKYVTQAEFLT